MNRVTAYGLASLACFCIATTAHAHYLWISVDRKLEGEQAVNIYFEESPQPGDGSYLDHFLGTSDVWIRTINQPAPILSKRKKSKLVKIDGCK